MAWKPIYSGGKTDGSLWSKTGLANEIRYSDEFSKRQGFEAARNGVITSQSG
jgi:hypothetical protein